MQTHQIVSQEEWFRIHKAHLAREKELTHFRDRLGAERRALPWVKIEKPYTFDTEAGRKSLAELFDGRSQLYVYHFMFAPQSRHPCPGCSFLADHFDGPNRHLKHHDVGLVAVSRAPLAELLPFKRRMDWKFDWVSSFGSDFNYDFQVSYTDEQIAAGKTVYNFEETPIRSPDMHGSSVFAKDENGDVFLTFVSRARGDDMLLGANNFLDLMPKGRNETGPNGDLMDWVRLHDEYDAAPRTSETHDCRR